METKPLTPETWLDFLEVMGSRGGEAGCWCMYYRLTSSEFKERQGDGNREAMRSVVSGGEVPGLIGYRDGDPVGWVGVGPRGQYGRLQRSRVTKPLDERPAWAVYCFVIPKRHRRSGVATELLEAAVAYAKSQGADLIEGYPMEPRDDEVPAFWSWMGFASMFERCGFEEVARRTETRPFMRRALS